MKDFLPALTKWYMQNARDLPWRKDTNPYTVWVSEVMLQQTRVSVVVDYFLRFKSALPTIEHLANTAQQSLLKLWEGLGYYSRVRNMQKAAQTVMQKHAGIFPKTHSEISGLCGIGDYTAGAIASICYNLPTPAVDGNVLRVMARLTNTPWQAGHTQAKKEVQKLLTPIYEKAQDRGMLTQALMELGATICIPKNPRCTDCPLRFVCEAQSKGSQNQLPLKAVKTKQLVSEMTVFILSCNNQTAVCKRKDKGLLFNLWQFPNVSGSLSPEEAIAQAEAFGCAPKDILQSVQKSHIFTHRIWQMTGYYFAVEKQDPQFVWANAKMLEEEIPLPSAFKQFLS